MLKEVTESKHSLFEGFGNDFGDLRSLAIIKPASKPEAVTLKYLNVYHSLQADAFEARLNALFTIKEKWTIGELETYLDEWVEPEQKLAV